MFTVFGVGYSFGAFFESITAEFGAGSGATALVFSITISLSFALGPFTGALADRLGPRPVLLLGAAALTIGLLITSQATSIVMAYLSYGIGVGVAIACGYVPMVATVGGWFVERRALALGMSVAGIGLGTLIGSPLSAALIDASSWQTTFVIYALVGGALLCGCAVVARPGPAAAPSPGLRSFRELMGIRDFATLYLASLSVTFGLFVPFVFLASYAEDRGAAPVAAATLVGVIGGASVIGRLGLGSLADRVGPVRLFRHAFFTMAASHLIWLVADDRYGVLVVYAAVLGIGYGGFIAISPAVVAVRFGLEGLGGVLGTLYTSAAIGSLAGPPLAGVLIDNAGYRSAIVGAAVMSLLGWMLLLRLSSGDPASDHPVLA
jgi:MFS family permease